MSSRIVNGPARRLLCRASPRIHGVTTTDSTEASSDRHAFWRRQYATKRILPTAHSAKPPRPKPAANPIASPAAPARTPRPAASQHGLPNRDPARLIFSAKDIPPPQEMMNNLESLGNTDLTALECMDGARRYVEIATPQESQWRFDLEKEHKLSPYLLHWTGLALISANTEARWRLGTHMLRSASELGYMPSTLTLVRIFRSMPPHVFERASSTIMYRDANARFEKGLADGTDPNAFTLQGIIYAKTGDDAKAMAMFIQATKAWQKAGRGEKAPNGRIKNKSNGEDTQKPAATADGDTIDGPSDAASNREFALPPPREPRWEWEISSVLEQAKIFAKDPRTAAKAEKMFRVAALELDNPHGFLMLAKLMGGPRDTPERRTYMLKAAISGEAEACREMGMLEKLAAAKTTNAKERAEHATLSKEWFRLAEGEDLSAYVKAEDIDDGNVES